jgi:hypothetical protein
LGNNYSKLYPDPAEVALTEIEENRPQNEQHKDKGLITK